MKKSFFIIDSMTREKAKKLVRALYTVPGVIRAFYDSFQQAIMVESDKNISDDSVKIAAEIADCKLRTRVKERSIIKDLEEKGNWQLR